MNTRTIHINPRKLVRFPLPRSPWNYSAQRHLELCVKRERALERVLVRMFAASDLARLLGDRPGPLGRRPGMTPDTLRDGAELAKLLVRRCAGFGLTLTIVLPAPSSIEARIESYLCGA